MARRALVAASLVLVLAGCDHALEHGAIVTTSTRTGNSRPVVSSRYVGTTTTTRPASSAPPEWRDLDVGGEGTRVEVRASAPICRNNQSVRPGQEVRFITGGLDHSVDVTVTITLTKDPPRLVGFTRSNSSGQIDATMTIPVDLPVRLDGPYFALLEARDGSHEHVAPNAIVLIEHCP